MLSALVPEEWYITTAYQQISLDAVLVVALGDAVSSLHM